MKSYSPKDISNALREVGVKKGDLVFFSVRMYSVGRMLNCPSKESLNKEYLYAIFEVIGEKGTLVVPSYSQQVGRFGIPYVHEETPTLTGIFSEYIRKNQYSIRSFHPVFSLTALGYNAEKICRYVGTNSFGAKSAYDNMFKHGGHSVCLGFEYEKGHIVTGAHYIECTYGVPYYYNKILKADVFKEGKRCDKIFTLNVRYMDFDIKNNYVNFIKEIDNRGLLHSYPVGESYLYSSKLSDQVKIGYELLSQNVYSFLDAPPNWEDGVIPFEGPQERLDPDKAKKINWIGFHLHGWGRS